MNDPFLTEPLSPADVAWLRMDGPDNRMSVVGLLGLGRPISIEEARRTIERRLLAFGRFKQRIESARRPRWVTDDQFDITYHVRREVLPPPGDRASLQRLVSELVSSPIDLRRPPWTIRVIEEFDGGGVLAVQVHHAVADGIALVNLLLQLADEHFPLIDRNVLPAYGREPSSSTVLDRLRGAAAAAGAGLANAGSGALRVVREPARLMGLASDAASVTAAAARIAFLPRDSTTRLKQEPGPQKCVAWTPALPLDDARAVAHHFNAKLNDVLMAALAGGLRRYLSSRSDAVDDVELGAVIPVNLRPMSDALDLGNEFGIVFLRLPIGIADAAERLREVQRRMDGLKASSEPIVALGIVKGIGAGPQWLHRWVVRLLSAKSSLVITNVPGPQSRLHLAGRAIEEVMFWVPRAGTVGLGVSILSYAGELRLGVAVDAGMVQDPESILAGFRDELAALVALSD